MRSLLVGLALALLCVSDAAAWGDHGHRAICDMAFNMLTPTARTKVLEILQRDGEYSRFSEACIDEDHPKLRRVEHFLNLPRDRLQMTDGNCFAETKCVISAIEGDLAVLGRAGSSWAQKAAALKGLGHWLGDVHQPLHISFKDDLGGNEIRRAGMCSSSDLHAVWDTCIPARMLYDFRPGERLTPDQELVKVYAAADRLRAAIGAADKVAWIQGPSWNWAAESYAITLAPETGYCTLKRSACWYSPGARMFTGRNKRSQTIDWPYISAAGSIVELRFKQASVRLAHLLNDALDPDYDPPTA